MVEFTFLSNELGNLYIYIYIFYLSIFFSNYFIFIILQNHNNVFLLSNLFIHLK